MDHKLQDLIRQQSQIHTEQKSMLDLLETEGREFNEIENEKYKKLDKAWEDYAVKIQNFKIGNRHKKEGIRPHLDDFEARDNRDKFKTVEDRPVTEKSSAWRRYLAFGENGLSIRERTSAVRDIEPVIISSREVRTTKQADLDVQGGFILADAKFSSDILVSADDETFALDVSTIEMVDDSLGFVQPKLDTDVDDLRWGVPELGTGTESEGPTWERRQWFANVATLKCKFSKTLAKISGGRLENFLKERMGYKFGIGVEQGWISGNGAGEILGMTVTNSGGITADRDNAVGNTTTQIKSDNLLDSLWKLKGQFAKRSSWLIHRDFVRMIKKQKTGTGEYLIKEPQYAGQSSLLLGRPLLISEYMPNSASSGEVCYLIGDMSKFKFVICQQWEVQVLVEKYAETNENMLIARALIDGHVFDELGFIRGRFAT